MFTGIVNHQLKIVGLQDDGSLRKVCIQLTKGIKKPKIGASVLINGICSTVTKLSKDLVMTVEYMPETRRITTVDKWQAGGTVHYESSMKIGDTIDGHFVFGHIDSVAQVSSVSSDKGDYSLNFSINKDWMRYLVPKGSVAIDGVSLTVVSVGDDYFSVSLIPHTLDKTHLSHLKTGDMVNIEFDMLAKYAQRYVAAEK
jgi:riboflavin synthase